MTKDTLDILLESDHVKMNSSNHVDQLFERCLYEVRELGPKNCQMGKYEFRTQKL